MGVALRMEAQRFAICNFASQDLDYWLLLLRLLLLLLLLLVHKTKTIKQE